ncbi:MAG: thiamine diphosphokinase [Chloroflexota bacterium]|nr:thiamine diphosphokinase [Chloroflexota bacterium]
MHIVIFAGGTLQAGTAVEAAIAQADMCIAADSGAAMALQCGCTPAAVVGDMDSLDNQVAQQLSAQGCRLVQAPVEKNETDTELAVQFAIAQGASKITLLGGLGGARFDHMVANVLLLAGYQSAPLYIVDGPAVGWLLRGPGRSVIHGHAGDLLSVLPLSSEASGIRNAGLYYPLHGETLHLGIPRGLSNMLTQEQAEVSLENGLLLIIHTCTQEL